MPKSTQLARLKSHLTAHRRWLKELAASTRRLDKLVSGMIQADGGSGKRRSTTRRSSELRLKHSVDSPAPVTVRRASPAASKVAGERRAEGQARADALERHWGNLF